MTQSVEDIEIFAETSSLYVEKIKESFSREEVFAHLKKFLQKKFSEDYFPLISNNNDTIYVILPSEIQTKIEGFSYHKELFDRSMDKFSEQFLDNFHKELFFLYEKYISNIGKDVYILDTAIKKFLILVINDNKKLQNIAKSMFYVMNLIHNDIQRKFGNFKELEFARFLIKGKLTSTTLTDISFRTFLTDDEDYNFIVNLFNDYSTLIFPEISTSHYKIISETDNIPELNLQNTKSRLKEIFNQILIDLDKFSAIELIERLDRLNDIIKINIGALRGIKQQIDSRIKKGVKSYNLSFLLNYLCHDIDKLLSIELLNEIFKSLEKKKVEIPKIYLSKRMFKTEFDYNAIIENMKKFYSDVFEPTIFSKIIEMMIEIWPIIKYKQTTLEEARWVGIRGREGGVFVLPDIKLEKRNIQKKEALYKIINNVSVLIYDIRGSSFMGFKLGNAKKEEEIRNKFQERLLNVVYKYGGFPIKDTGDGGIILFSQNSHELYTSFMQYRSGKKEIENLILIEGELSAKNAVLCARDMVIESKNFVKENLKNYEDWFRQVEGFKLQFGGITYEELPPSIKRIFQVGIGIASGEPLKDVSFCINKFNEPDLTGNLVREANLFSKVREKDESTIIIDLKTFLSFLITLEEFLPEDVKDEKFLQSFTDDIYLKEMKSWYQGLKGRYLIKKYKMVINKVFSKVYIDEGESLQDVVIKGEFTGDAIYKNIYDSKVEKERSVYKIIVKE